MAAPDTCRVIGCDPGLNGGIAAVYVSGAVFIDDMPIRPGFREVDGEAVREFIEKHNPGFIILEDLHGPANFKLGSAYGALIVACHSARYTPKRVAPRVWQTELLPVTARRSDTKKASVAAAKRLYPSAPLIPPGKRAPKHDRADALMIAEYGLRHYV